MINKIKSLTNTEDKKRLMSNFFSLSVLQGANYILPLITLPYLVRVLGVEYFGLLAFSTATITYLGIITDYGFNLSATKQVSIHRNNQSKLNEIFSAIMIIKVILMIVCLILLTILVFSFSKFSQHWDIYFLTFGVVLGQVLFPVWFFQGMERMKYITYLNIVSKLIFTGAIFFFVHQKEDYYLVPIFTSLGFIIVGIWSLYLIKREFSISFHFQKYEDIVYYLKNGWHVFVSNVAISLYTVSTVFILGIFTNNIIVGYYSAAEKIIRAFIGLFIPFSQAIYPYIGKKAHESKKEAIAILQKMSLGTAFFTLLLSFFVFLGAEWLSNTILGEEYQKSIIIIQVLSFLPLIIGLNNIFGILTMLNFGYEKQFSTILVYLSGFHLVLSFVLIYFYSYIGSAISVVATESLITLVMYIFLAKNNIHLLFKLKEESK